MSGVPDEFNLFDIPAMDPDEGPLHVMAVSETWLQYILGAIETILTRPSVWDGTEEERETVVSQVDTLLWYLTQPVEAKTMTIGDVGISFNSTLSDGRLWCDGTQYTKADYPDLYAALDPAFHVDADNFTVPDLRERVAIGASVTYELGTTGGEIDHQLTVDEMPSHDHEMQFRINQTGFGNYHMAVGSNSGTFLRNDIPIFDTGGDLPHNNMQPYIVCRYWIQAV